MLMLMRVLLSLYCEAESSLNLDIAPNIVQEIIFSVNVFLEHLFMLPLLLGKEQE